jgi:hypothetical protein
VLISFDDLIWPPCQGMMAKGPTTSFGLAPQCPQPACCFVTISTREVSELAELVSGIAPLLAIPLNWNGANGWPYGMPCWQFPQAIR